MDKADVFIVNGEKKIRDLIEIYLENQVYATLKDCPRHQGQVSRSRIC